eukprot:9486437-Pyramimonas_sp.AAC.1
MGKLQVLGYRPSCSAPHSLKAGMRPISLQPPPGLGSLTMVLMRRPPGHARGSSHLWQTAIMACKAPSERSSSALGGMPG